MTSSPDPATEPEPTEPLDDEGPVLGPDDVDPVDHTVDRVVIDGETTSIPAEWL